ncbi:MAG: ABC transporter, partial [Candidatus Limnocylindrales bacterium]
RSKRLLARGASVGVNVLGTGVMLGTFLHTGGLTGAEVGVAAATAFLNQKLLSALFGEAAMVELVAAARRRLQDALTATFEEERARYDRLLPATGVLPALAVDLRDAAAAVRTLPAAGR